MFISLEHSVKGTQAFSYILVVPINYQKYINKFQ